MWKRVLQTIPKRLVTQRQPAISAVFNPIFQRNSSTLVSLLNDQAKKENEARALTDELKQLQEKIENVMTIDSPENELVTLSFSHNNEDIQIQFHEIHEFDSEIYGSGEEEDDEFLRVNFSITITRGGQKLQFGCLAGDNLSVQCVAVSPEDFGPEDVIPHLFEDLDEEIQNSFMEYLNERHINDELAKFIDEYASLKGQNEYASFLENAAKFFQ